MCEPGRAKSARSAENRSVPDRATVAAATAVATGTVRSRRILASSRARPPAAPAPAGVGAPITAPPPRR